MSARTRSRLPSDPRPAAPGRAGVMTEQIVGQREDLRLGHGSAGRFAPQPSKRAGCERRPPSCSRGDIRRPASGAGTGVGAASTRWTRCRLRRRRCRRSRSCSPAAAGSCEVNVAKASNTRSAAATAHLAAGRLQLLARHPEIRYRSAGSACTCSSGVHGHGIVLTGRSHDRRHQPYGDGINADALFFARSLVGQDVASRSSSSRAYRY